MGAMFQGMNAYASPQPRLQKSNEPITTERSVRLEKGPAYREAARAGLRHPVSGLSPNEDWPAYRYDGFRGGITESQVPATLKVRWQAKLPTKPSALISAAGMVFVCDIDTHTLFAGTLGSSESSPNAATRRRRGAKKGGGRGNAGKEIWRLHIPITGKAIAMAGDVLLVAGEPMRFDNPTYRTYVAAYDGQLGGRLLAVSATDGKQLAEYKLNAAPVWDSIALANGQLYISLANGMVQCLSPFSIRF